MRSTASLPPRRLEPRRARATCPVCRSDDRTTHVTQQDRETDPDLALMGEKFERALTRLEQASDFAKPSFQAPVLDVAKRLLRRAGGLDVLYAAAPRFDRAGLFAGSDWQTPETLLPNLVSRTFESGAEATIVVEVLSELRLLAVATRSAVHPGVSAEQARSILTQIVALNLQRMYGVRSEAARVGAGPLDAAVDALFAFLIDHVGFDDILDSLLEEVRRILAQRPIQTDAVRGMVSQISVTLADGVVTSGDARLGADRLTSALFGPTENCADDPGVAAYEGRLGSLDRTALQQEARTCARAMHDTGLVSDYHAVLLRWLANEDRRELIGLALGLSATGADVLRCHPDLVTALIRRAVHPETSQTVYSLAKFLERGLLHVPSMGPALWRQLQLRLPPAAQDALDVRYGPAPGAADRLLAGILAMLGQPLGVGQGNNPTCQAARALSMWAQCDPDFLLHLVDEVAQTGSITMHFEGATLRTAELPAGLAKVGPMDADPVSTLLVPHLDRVYAEMGRLCIGRAGDPHRWINPEFHGWWVGRTFEIAIDVATGKLDDLPGFVRRFHGTYHLEHNGGRPVIHPQPAGLAVTDSNAEFVGWHAITLLRVAEDQAGVMRVYFYNPNNDSSQDWGNGVQVSISGHGERHGEASLPFAELASRLYIFHDDAVVPASGADVPDADVAAVVDMAKTSWAADRVPDAAPEGPTP